MADADPCALSPACRRLGVTAGAVLASGAGTDPARVDAAVAPLRAAGLRWYVENIATDFYAADHRWTPDHPVYLALHRSPGAAPAGPADPAAFIREPSCPTRLAEPHRGPAGGPCHAEAAGDPLYYDLGDETGIADLAAQWDFDLSAASLDGDAHLAARAKTAHSPR